MESNYKSLEFNRIESELVGYFSFLENIENFKNEELITDSKELSREHIFLNEMVKYFNEGFVINLTEVKSLGESFDLLYKNGTLDRQTLLNFAYFIDNVSVLIDAFKPRKELERINDLALDLKDYHYISKRITDSIMNDLSIPDDASSGLYAVRQKLRHVLDKVSSLARELSKKYSNYLSETKETIKDGLPCLAVKATYKSYVKGMVADISNTGNTVYIVPLEILNVNNEIYELEEKEREEEERIVKALSDLIKENIEYLYKDYCISLRLDSLIARVKYGESYHGQVAEVSDEIYIEDLAHPLIDRDIVVRNSVSLGGKNPKICVISGPNAGGKTVLIKAISLACYMNQRGLLVSSLGQARLKVFKDIFFIAGDGQSIMDNLSTFSGHIAQIKESLDKVDRDSLFIVDEIGQGTSPLDGEALGNATIDYLKEIGCFAILTSHYEGLKEKAVNDNDVMVSAMIFNEEDIKPTFKYKENMIGKSYALEVASNLGLNSHILDMASEYLNNRKDSKVKITMDKIMKLQDENLKLKEEYETKLKELDELNSKRKSAIEALKTEKANIKAKAQEKIDKIVEEKIDEIDTIYKSHKGKLDMNTFSKLKGELNKIQNENDEKEQVSSKVDFKEGDTVRVTSINNIGVVKKINRNKKIVELDIDGMFLKTSFDDCTFLKSKNAISYKPKVSTIDKVFERKSGVPLECNLIGLYVDEAREKLAKYLDDCLLMHYHEVRIIHGHGTGKLRTMVQEFCKNNKNVKSIRFGDTYEGGVGATVVYLK